MLEHSDACERNKQPILEILKTVFSNVDSVLEIGSGTAQHAVFFAQQLPHIKWLPSDLEENIPAIKARLKLEAPGNVCSPVILDVKQQPWPVTATQAVFTANSLHIMSWKCVQHFFRGVGQVLNRSGVLCIYGPFKYTNEFTSESNRQFDLWLKQRDPFSGIRDFEAINSLAEEQGLKHHADYSMPANNQMLLWLRD